MTHQKTEIGLVRREKRQRTGALQDACANSCDLACAWRLGLRWSSTALGGRKQQTFPIKLAPCITPSHGIFAGLLSIFSWRRPRIFVKDGDDRQCISVFVKKTARNKAAATAH